MRFARCLAARLRDEGARFEIIGSVADGVENAADLDVIVPPGPEDLDYFLTAVRTIGGWSLLSPSLPSPTALRRAGVWHFGTPEGPLDAFVVEAAG